jgi:hypothetical protein
MRKLLLAVFLVAAGSGMALAGTDQDAAGSGNAPGRVRFEDFAGRWCVTGAGINTFSKTQLLVEFPDGRTRTLQVEKMEFEGNRINIHWAPKGSQNNTWYELSDDKKLLVQLPNTSGDMGPRRELRRCPGAIRSNLFFR